ncbi:hypothetical protein O9929_20135 [Vibrio lentus]|nr:hypothetical protein [Vibrio lentus]
MDYVSSDYQYELGNEGAKRKHRCEQNIPNWSDNSRRNQHHSGLIADLNEIGSSEANVASGYHAIEFLLWGQDLNGTNSGAVSVLTLISLLAQSVLMATVTVVART